MPSPRPASRASRSLRTTSSSNGTPRDVAHGGGCRAGAHALPAVPRLRGHARAAAARAFDRAERKFDLMGELGADLILVCSNARPSRSAASTAPPRTCASWAYGRPGEVIRVGFEALAWGRHVHDHRDAWEIVRRADHSRVGMILDSFHTLSRKIDPASIRSIPADKLFLVQLADAPLIDMDVTLLEPPFPQHAGRGRPAGSGLPYRGRRHRLSMAGSASRSSTTVPRRHRRVRSPSMAIARWST